MANLIDLYAEKQAALTGDDDQPALTLANSSNGAALKVQSGKGAANATVTAAIVAGGQSVASGAVFAFLGDALVSAATIKFTTGAVDGTYALRVVTPKGTFGWIPILPDAAVTLAAA